MQGLAEGERVAEGEVEGERETLGTGLRVAFLALGLPEREAQAEALPEALPEELPEALTQAEGAAEAVAGGEGEA